MSGLEFVQGLVDGTLPLNTIAQTLGYDVTEVDERARRRYRGAKRHPSQSGRHGARRLRGHAAR